MMNTNNINKLLEKYWNAESSLEEEQILSQYFESDDVAKEHEQYKPLFCFYASTSKVKLENKKEIPESKPKVFSISRFAGWGVIGIAASLLILVSVGVINLNPQGKDYDQQFSFESIAITEEEEALEVTKDALAYLGVKWDNSSQIIKTNVSKMESVSILK
jgi:hypothetical protein